MKKEENKTEDWEIEWDKKFFKFHEIGAIENSEEMKPFIRELLSFQRQEIIEEVVKCVQIKVKAYKNYFINKPHNRVDYNNMVYGFNSCREEVLKKIELLKKK